MDCSSITLRKKGEIGELKICKIFQKWYCAEPCFSTRKKEMSITVNKQACLLTNNIVGHWRKTFGKSEHLNIFLNGV